MKSKACVSPLGAMIVGSLALAATALSPQPAFAQLGPIESPVRVEFLATGGVLTPTATLVDGSGVSGGDRELSESFALGGGIGVHLLGGFGVEGQLLFSPEVELQTVGTGDVVSDADVLAATAHLVYRLPLPLIQPFLGAGGGVRRLSFDDPTALATEDESDLTGSVLAGAYVGLVPGLTIRLEARDYISSFTDPRSGNSELQNDLAFLAGLAWRVP